MQKLFSDYRKQFNILMYGVGLPLGFLLGIFGGVVLPKMNAFYRFLLLFMIMYPILLLFLFYFYKKGLRRITKTIDILHETCDNKPFIDITSKMLEEKPDDVVYTVIAAGYRVNALKNSNLELARHAISDFKQKEIYSTYSNIHFYANFLIESCYVLLLEKDEEEFHFQYDKLMLITGSKPLKNSFLLKHEVSRLNHEIAILTSIKQQKDNLSTFDPTLAVTPYHRALVAYILEDPSLYQAEEPYGNCWFTEGDNILSK